MLFERRCPGCGRLARSVCGACFDELVAGGEELGPSELEGLARVIGLDWLGAGFVYSELAARIILAAKNGGRRDVLRQLAGLVPEGLEPVEVVTWVPASRVRRRERGYDQGQVLARQMARDRRVRCRRLLSRPRSDAQAGRNRAERLAGPHLVATTRHCPSAVLVVDDVTTTGASLASAAKALRAAGASYVAGGVLAAVPAPRREARGVRANSGGRRLARDEAPRQDPQGR